MNDLLNRTAAAAAAVMVRLTEELIRRKAEHHDGVLPDLEEISLHQLEIERIEVIGSVCRKLKILYLQNNIIPRLEGLSHLRDLGYLNVALNNIVRIEGLQCVSRVACGAVLRGWGCACAGSPRWACLVRGVAFETATLRRGRRNCEFLHKLDLTVNFVDFDTIEDSVGHLVPLSSMRELFLLGNPGARLSVVIQQQHWQRPLNARHWAHAQFRSGRASVRTWLHDYRSCRTSTVAR